MSSIQSLYAKKKMRADEAVRLIPKSGNISLAYFVGIPVSLTEALARASIEGVYDKLNLYCMRSSKHMAEQLFRPEVAEHILFRPFFMGPDERKFLELGWQQGKKYIEYIPGSFSRVPIMMSDTIGIDTFLVRVSPMDKHGYFSLGLTGAYSQRLIRSARQVIIEVDENMPRAFGDALLHVSDVTALVEHNSPIELMPAKPLTDTDHKIASHILPLIQDRACVQFGIGTVPSAIAALLKDHKNLGIHTELLSDNMVDLVECGAVTNRYKKLNTGRSVFNVAMGSQRLIDFVHDNPGVECYGAEYVNDPYVIAQNDGVISVNSFIEIDLLGQVDAEVIGAHQFSGTGGALDFVRGAVMSKGGKSFLAAPSTGAHGKISRIVPRLSSVTTQPRFEIQYVVTENGICNLEGKSSTERAKALIGLADPAFRESLYNEAKKAGFF